MISFSIAKVNLGLWITGKRADGFHDIQSIFLPVALHDSIEINTAPESSISVFNADFDIPAEKNLLWICYQLMQKRFSLPALRISLVKNIPSGGGIGGGSGNVGAFINMLDQNFNLGLSLKERQSIALEIGSDCAFFIDPKPTLVTGRGDELEVLEYFPRCYLVLIYSEVQIATKDAYAGIEPIMRMTDIAFHLQEDQSEWKDFFVNDFEKVVYNRYPSLKQNVQAFYENGAFYASLSGTGGCQFALFTEKPQLNKSLHEKVIWQGFVGG